MIIMMEITRCIFYSSVLGLPVQKAVLDVCVCVFGVGSGGGGGLPNIFSVGKSFTQAINPSGELGKMMWILENIYFKNLMHNVFHQVWETKY